MTVQDDKASGQDDQRRTADKPDEDENRHTEKAEADHGDDHGNDEKAEKDEKAESDEVGDHHPTEKPEPDEDDKKAAAEMMEAYKDKPTIVLPGSKGMVSGTAVNEWLDDDGSPKFEVPDNASSELKEMAEKAKNDKEKQDQIEKDKALNEELKKAAAQENKGEND
jgi:metallophosphoesterase superfamily enzyme